jgi:hypothetical protein
LAVLAPALADWLDNTDHRRLHPTTGNQQSIQIHSIPPDTRHRRTLEVHIFRQDVVFLKKPELLTGRLINKARQMLNYLTLFIKN